MTPPIRTPILLLLAALFATFAPLARADVKANADGDTATLNSFVSMVNEVCPELVDGLLQEDQISAVVTDRAAFTTDVCQCVVHATLNDQRTYGLMTAGADLLALERNTRYFMAKLMSSSFRCFGLELDDILMSYSLDIGTDKSPATP